MVCEESTKELKQRQGELLDRTTWLKELKKSVMRKTKLCMFIMAGIFFLLVMIQNSFYAVIPAEYQSAVILLSRYGKWVSITGVIVIYAVLKDSEMEGV